MPGLVNSGKLKLLDWAVRLTGTDMSLRLFQNDITPDEASILADFTEADFTDYAAISLARGSWNAAALNVGDQAEIQYNATQTFIAGLDTTQTIYGWYLATAGGILVGARRFTTPINLTDTDEIQVLPVIVLDT